MIRFIEQTETFWILPTHFPLKYIACAELDLNFLLILDRSLDTADAWKTCVQFTHNTPKKLDAS